MVYESILGKSIVYVKVMSEYLLYIIIVFSYMVLHELSHILMAKYVKLSMRIQLVKVHGIPLGIGLSLEGYESKRSILEVKGDSRRKYLAVALAPYWLIPVSIAMIYSDMMVIRIAGMVLSVVSIVNLPLEFFQPWSV